VTLINEIGDLSTKKSLGEYHLIDRSEIPSKINLQATVDRLEKDVAVLSKFEGEKYDQLANDIKPTLSFLRLLLSRCR
jgi:hypothetical protein